MRRPATGGTTHPDQARPGMGFGRPLRPRRTVVEVLPFSVRLDAFLRGEVIEPVTTDDRSSVTSTDSLA